MATFDLPVIGPTEFAPTQEGYWGVGLILPAGHADLHFSVDGQEMSAGQIRRVERFIADLAGFDRAARAALREDYEKGEAGQAQEFLAFHVEDAFTQEERIRWFGPDEPGAMGVEHLLAALNLYVVGLHPDNADGIAVFDYTIGRRFYNAEGRYITDTDQILCVKFDAEGKVVSVSWES
jgi:Protein of unknown function (DUF2004)